MNHYTVGEHDTRPWGTWQVIGVGDNFIVKQITVNPGEILSLQRHQYRSEHWTIVSGSGVVTLKDKKINVQHDAGIYIPVGTWHRIENNSEGKLVFIEVQTGDTLDELDIERKNDKYKRA